MKYDFTQYVTKDSVMSLDGRNKLEIMDQLITRAADLTKLNRDVIFRLTWKREQMMTTGVGGMLALPHIRVNDITRPYVIIASRESDRGLPGAGRPAGARGRVHRRPR